MPRLTHTAVAHGLFMIPLKRVPLDGLCCLVSLICDCGGGRAAALSGARARGRRLGRRVEKKKAQMAKAELTARAKEELKMVALGTSKINYLDPRITIAWCKAREVPLEKARARRRPCTAALPYLTLPQQRGQAFRRPALGQHSAQRAAPRARSAAGARAAGQGSMRALLHALS
jgi:hypothetical protein